MCISRTEDFITYNKSKAQNETRMTIIASAPLSPLSLSEEKTQSHSTMLVSICKNNDVVNDSDSDTDQTTGTDTDTDDDDINYDNDNEDDDENDFDSDSSVVTTTKLSNDNNNNNVVKVKKQKKVVSFGSVYIRQYERIVGDHPETRVGVPVSIGWKYYDNPEQYSSTPISLEDYDDYRISKGRGKYLLKMSSITRRNMLLNVFDIPEQELIQAEKKTKKIKQQRDRSNRKPILVAQITGYQKKIGTKIRNCGMALLKGMSYAAQSGMMSGSSSMYQ